MRIFPRIVSRELHKVKNLYRSYSFIEEFNTTSLSYHFLMIALGITMQPLSLVNGKSFLLFPRFILIIAESLVQSTLNRQILSPICCFSLVPRTQRNMEYLHTISYQTKYNISPTLSQSSNTPHMSIPLCISTLIPMLLIFAPHKNKIGYLLEKGEVCRIASVFPKTETLHLILQAFEFITLFHIASFVAKSSNTLNSFFTRHHYFHCFFSDCVRKKSIKEHYHHTIIPLYNLN